MKIIYFKLMLIISISCSLCGCKKYLDVKPEDKILEEQVFTSRTGINNALNGLYINLTKNNLYGDNLTLSTVDILAQRYNVSSSHKLYQLSIYAYADKSSMDKIDEIWTNAYVTILNANAFVENVNKYKGVLDATSDSLFQGEAIGIRAMLHFDLLRLFGPVYNSADSVKTSIPYYQQSKTTVNDLLPANKVLDLVTADLSRAENLLKKDPVITSGVLPGSLQDGGDFLRNRNYRMNYFAVKALQARVNLYRGNKTAALQAAQVLISNADKFKWTTTANALNEKINPDRIFSTEMIFGVQNTQLYSNYQNEFDPALEDSKILAAIPGRLTTVFEANENDYRYNLNWVVPANGGKTYRTFYKYADVIDKTKPFRSAIPLIKISEMFYIAAESSSDQVQALTYLNKVRNNRGLLSLTAAAALSKELQKEYQKEFYGEGQLFYYYKRNKITTIPNGSSGSGNITMSAANYVLPLPLSETQYR
ncbi:hypothetical protein TH53_25445 [Pedobacter lusitanus]|uniref:SusD-like N-terminal domain-containing protein n=1 Tax=Pedobacter lusitanus TaxID=1503925 RepID=A0A0D0GBG2_9SPHI|nr:RagB/SusD family nutrient uptake outer membrane protein [Pedobacter lusitanus]KIO74607.1 hypothetical protein TH53_25445 [Pedobacter lusitanus]